MNRAVTYVGVYKPHPGQEAALLNVVKRHVPTLRKEGLATEHPVMLLKAADGRNLAEAQKEFAHFERLEGVVA